METTLKVIGMVVTDQNPKNLLVPSEDWDALLSQFKNCTRVEITLTEIPAEAA